jgi:hypothetical protein
MNDREQRLNQAMETLPREIPPAQDLWPAIEERIRTARTPRGNAWRDLAGGGPFAGWRAVAATALLVIATSALTFLGTRQYYAPGNGTRGADGNGYMPVTASMLPIDYQMARGELMVVLEASLARLDPGSRRLVERNLAEIRSALAAIDRALADDPDNASLHQLLVSTSQQELNLLRSVQRLAAATQQEQST